MPDTIRPRYVVTYDTVTEESAAEGDYADHGFYSLQGNRWSVPAMGERNPHGSLAWRADYEAAREDATVDYDPDDDTDPVDWIVSVLQDAGATEPNGTGPHADGWSTVDGETDYATGEETRYGYRLEGFAPDQLAQVYARLTRRR
jgi:hypothetical protein